MKGRLELDFIQNDNCLKGCNRADRKEISENDLCSGTNSCFDNLPIRCVENGQHKRFIIWYNISVSFQMG